MSEVDALLQDILLVSSTLGFAISLGMVLSSILMDRMKRIRRRKFEKSLLQESVNRD